MEKARTSRCEVRAFLFRGGAATAARKTRVFFAFLR
jgi:hypothetical protein